ncbi:MAG TPA: alpha,alpha-trehalase TreA [Cyclobacteriaceae bacterium]|jgi:alpha,alpha-trehalase|nr:alpha,alpha-trehalase TreA [Cyclobacteriaceae bacterium]
MSQQIHDLGELFEEVQLKNILGDGKTFPDCTPKRPLTEIDSEYHSIKNSSGFDLKKFVLDNFSLPKDYSTNYVTESNTPIKDHINDLWHVLTRIPEQENSSLIPLPKPYVVPGGRFREIYYWDSYFTMLGLRESGRFDLISNMIDNFAFLIDEFGYIPNGNRSYFLGRSQPPFFSLMVALLSEGNEKEILIKYLPALEKEYQFWMKGKENLTQQHRCERRVALMPDGTFLNRYWDENDTPRPESFKEDLELSHRTLQKPEDLFRNLRAAAESGWDFSSRWFKDINAFETIHTTEIIPVDLNCLLVHSENLLSKAHKWIGNEKEATIYSAASSRRVMAVRKYCWNDTTKFFFDFDVVGQKQKEHMTLAAAFPLFLQVATPEQANFVQHVLDQKFLRRGGFVTTLNKTGQQWDAPNGWAPLQWTVYRGLLNYNFNSLAEQLRRRWTEVITRVYSQTGKLTEKYNVVQEGGDGGGGEYPNQDGFGWTNGVFLAISAKAAR